MRNLTKRTRVRLVHHPIREDWYHPDWLLAAATTTTFTIFTSKHATDTVSQRNNQSCEHHAAFPLELLAAPDQRV
jgi:hypothetical protein